MKRRGFIICVAILLLERMEQKYGGNDYDVLYVKETSDNGYIAVGDTIRNNIAYAWAIKTDENGNLEWENVDVSGSYLATYVQETNDRYRG